MFFCSHHFCSLIVRRREERSWKNGFEIRHLIQFKRRVYASISMGLARERGGGGKRWKQHSLSKCVHKSNSYSSTPLCGFGRHSCLFLPLPSLSTSCGFRPFFRVLCACVCWRKWCTTQRTHGGAIQIYNSISQSRHFSPLIGDHCCLHYFLFRLNLEVIVRIPEPTGAA